MNLYLLERTDKVGWDETRGAVVAAETEDEARAYFPAHWSGSSVAFVASINIACTLIGIACEGVEHGIILQDFKGDPM